MLAFLQIVSLLVVAVALTASLAHLMELPGKKRLTKEQYFAVQPIYYPGFTLAGASEPLAVILLLIRLAAARSNGVESWLVLIALLGIAGMQLVYWLVTHPLNSAWLHEERLSGAGSAFFAFAAKKERSGAATLEWTHLRDRWEHSHAWRAVLAAISFVALVVAPYVG